MMALVKRPMVAKRFVDVALVVEAFVEKKLVVVAFVPVAFTQVKLVVEAVTAEMKLVVAYVLVRSEMLEDEIESAPGIESVPDMVVSPETVRLPVMVVVARLDVADALRVVAETEPAKLLPVIVALSIAEPVMVPPENVELSIVTEPNLSILFDAAMTL